MNLKKSFSFLAFTACAPLSLAVGIPIVNASFEADFANPGDYPSLVPQGWSPLDPNGILDFGADLTGVVNPTGSTFFPGGVPDGNNAAYIYLAGDIEGGPVSLRQILTSNLQADTHYTFQVEVGNIASGFGPPPGSPFFDLEGFPGYRVQLLAGGVVLAEDDNSLTIPDGEFRTSTVEYVSGSSGPLLGQALEVRLTNLNMRFSNEHPGIEVDWDVARLDAAPVPEPATLLALGLGVAALRRRKVKRS